MTKLTLFTHRVLFRVKHIPNLLVRCLSYDRYYICEECHKIHKRDDKELRLEGPDNEHRSAGKWWYGSVSHQCFVDQQLRVNMMLRNAVIKKLEEDLWIPDNIEEY
jgi:hypothetical protein